MRLTVLLAFVFAFAAEAATTYRVTLQGEGDDGTSSTTATVTVDGQRFRIDFPTGSDRTYNRVLSHDGGATFIAVNDELETWFPLDQSPLTIWSRYAIGYGPASKPRKIKGAGGKWSYTLVTDVMGTSVHMKCTIDIHVEPATDLPRAAWPASVLFLAEIPEVDKAIGATVREFPRKIVVTVTRQFEGGPRMTQTMTRSVSDIQPAVDVPASFFEKPGDYREQAPVVGTPGESSR